MTLLQRLQSYSQTNALPMHMPGHKRNTALAPYLQALSADLDITEIQGFSNLHDPEGMLAERMKAAAALWGSKRAWWLIGGSTAGLLSAIDAATQPGDKVLIGRNCHKSVYNACMLCHLQPVYILPQAYPHHSFSDQITPAQVEQAFAEHPDIRLAVLTSPTYEGICADLPAISDIVHRHGGVLLVDEAHGAHFGLHNSFPTSAVTQGADMVVQSLHKTLPSLTQTAMLHLCSDRVDADELGFRLSVYQTSSPSYLLMASIDSCVQLLAAEKDSLLPRWKAVIEAFYAALHLRHLTTPLRYVNHADPSKLLISTAGADITGPTLAQRLREDFAIETEMSTADTVLCMTGIGDSEADLLRLAQALNTIDGELTAAVPAPLPALPLPTAVMPMADAAKAPWETVTLKEAQGRIAADFLWAYPPGIPLVTPGEMISRELLVYISQAKSAHVDLHSPKPVDTGCIRALKKG